MADVVQQPVLKALSGMLTSGQEFAPELLESLLTNNPQQTAVQTPPQGETLSQQIRRLSQKFSGGARAGLGGAVGGLLGNPDIGKTNQQVLASRIREAGGLFSDATNQEIRPELIEEIKSLGTPEQISAVTQIYSTLAKDKAKKQVLISEATRRLGKDNTALKGVIEGINAGVITDVDGIDNFSVIPEERIKNVLLKLFPQEGDVRRDLVEQRIITSENIQDWKDVPPDVKLQNISYKDTDGNSKVMAAWIDKDNQKVFGIDGKEIKFGPTGFTIVGDAEATLDDVQDPTKILGDTDAVFRRKIQDELLKSIYKLRSLDGIVDKMVDDFGTFKGRAETYLGDFLSKAQDIGGQFINDELEKLFDVDLIEKAGKSILYLAPIEEYFQQRRHEITGAQAALKELQALRQDILNKTMSPTKVKEALKDIIQRSLKRINFLRNEISLNRVDLSKFGAFEDNLDINNASDGRLNFDAIRTEVPDDPAAENVQSFLDARNNANTGNE